MIRDEREVILLIIRYLRSKKKNSKTFSWELAVDNGKKNRKLTVLLRTSAWVPPETNIFLWAPGKTYFFHISLYCWEPRILMLGTSGLLLIFLIPCHSPACLEMRNVIDSLTVSLLLFYLSDRNWGLTQKNSLERFQSSLCLFALVANGLLDPRT